MIDEMARPGAERIQAPLRKESAEPEKHAGHDDIGDPTRKYLSGLRRKRDLGNPENEIEHKNEREPAEIGKQQMMIILREPIHARTIANSEFCGDIEIDRSAREGT